MWTPNQDEIDRGAEALRQIEQGGRLLRAWDQLPNYDKRKWRQKSEAVLRAAMIVVNNSLPFTKAHAAAAAARHVGKTDNGK